MQEFQYQPFVNPYAGSIADEIARSGDAHARAAMAIGQAHARAAEIGGLGWGRAIESIGQIPAQIQAQKYAETDRQLKEQELAMTIEQRQAVQAQRVATIGGRLAGVSSSPEVFADRVKQAVSSGLVHPEIGQHMIEQAATAGADGWPALRQSYVDFADQFTPAVPLKQDEQLVRPSVGGGASVIASGPPKMITMRPGDQLVPETGGQPVASAPFAPGTGQHVVNGQVLDASGNAVGAAVPKQETPSEVAQRQASTLKLTREAQEIDQKLAGTTPLSPKDRAELEIRRSQIALETARNDRMERKEDVDNPRYQGTLEKQYRDIAAKVVSSRNGVLGVEDAKVIQAKHLIGMMEQFKDQAGNYQIPVAQQMELAMGLAALIAPRGVPTERQVEELKQRTAKGDVAGMLTYITGNAVSGSTQGIAKMLRESIERQGQIAEGNREKELDAIRAFRPTDLQESRATGIEQGLGGLNSMRDVGVGVPKDGTAGTIDGKPVVWKQSGPKGPGWYTR